VKYVSDAPISGRLLALPTNFRLGWTDLGRDKHFSLLPKNYKFRKKKSFVTLGPYEKLKVVLCHVFNLKLDRFIINNNKLMSFMLSLLELNIDTMLSPVSLSFINFV